MMTDGTTEEGFDITRLNYLPVKTVAEYCGCKDDLIRRLEREGRIKAGRTNGGRVLEFAGKDLPKIKAVVERHFRSPAVANGRTGPMVQQLERELRAFEDKVGEHSSEIAQLLGLVAELDARVRALEGNDG